ncbi:HMG (high mobility group) box protein [Ceratobasidium sp. AG-Ba]|nr:HMG (high mobility group) box protein [Ceratobasidium sp. AG-Ba]
MSVGLRQSDRSLIAHDTSYQSDSPLALRPAGSPRLSTAGTAARARAIRSDAQIGYPRSGSPVSDDSPGSREPSPDDDCESHVGPVRSIKSHSRRQPPGHIPRPRNAFILYRTWYVKQDFLAGVENDHREISRIVGKIWKGLSESERDYWRVAAQKEKREHALKHPNYKYSPNSRRDGPPPPPRHTAPRSTGRARKPESPSNGRASDIAEAYLAGSRRRSLSSRVCEFDEKRRVRELEIVAKRAAPALSIRVPPRTGELPTKIDSSSRQSSPGSGDMSSSSLDSASVDTPSPQAKPEHQQWSLAACSAPLPEFSLDSDVSYPHATYESFGAEVARAWPFREGFSGSETLNTIMSYDDLTHERGPLNDSNECSTAYHQYSITSESEHATTTAPELQPFGRIAQCPTYLASDVFDTPYGHLPSDYATVGSYFEQLQQTGSHTQPSTDTAAGEDLGLLAEWCAPDSPVFVEAPPAPAEGTLKYGSTSASTIAAPVPVYPRRFGFCSTWTGDLDDLDAYRYAIDGVPAEVDGFDTEDLTENEGGRI